jgi:hypothetical protein
MPFYSLKRSRKKEKEMDNSSKIYGSYFCHCYYFHNENYSIKDVIMEKRQVSYLYETHIN